MDLPAVSTRIEHRRGRVEKGRNQNPDPTVLCPTMMKREADEGEEEILKISRPKVRGGRKDDKKNLI